MLSSLPYEILDFIRRVRARPTDGSDPGLLDHLESMARSAWDGAFVALYSPMATETWEAQGLLVKSQEKSAQVPLEFPRPVEILGFNPTVRPKDPPTAFAASDLFATNDDIDISISIDRKEDLVTQSPDSALSTNEGPNNFVTSSNVSVLVPRLFGKKLTAPAPKLFITWRWKAGANIWAVDHVPCLGVFARYC